MVRHSSQRSNLRLNDSMFWRWDQFSSEWFEAFVRRFDVRSNGSAFTSELRFKAEWFEFLVLGINLTSTGSRFGRGAWI